MRKILHGANNLLCTFNTEKKEIRIINDFERRQFTKFINSNKLYYEKDGNILRRSSSYKDNDKDVLKWMFVVGEKCKFAMESSITTGFINEDRIDADIEKLVKKINDNILKKSTKKINPHSITGELVLKECDYKNKSKTLLYLNMISHNIDSPKDSLNVSNTTRKEAINYFNKDDNNYIIYSFRSELNRPVSMMDVNLFLEERGVKWYKDKHNEVINMLGIFPHTIIGLEKQNTFIINPSLLKYLCHGNNGKPALLDIKKEIIEIDQSDFDSLLVLSPFNSSFIHEDGSYHYKGNGGEISELLQ